MEKLQEFHSKFTFIILGVGRKLKELTVMLRPQKGEVAHLQAQENKAVKRKEKESSDT